MTPPVVVPVLSEDASLAAAALQTVAAEHRRLARSRSLSGSRYVQAREALRRQADRADAAAARILRGAGRAAA